MSLCCCVGPPGARGAEAEGEEEEEQKTGGGLHPHRAGILEERCCQSGPARQRRRGQSLRSQSVVLSFNQRIILASQFVLRVAPQGSVSLCVCVVLRSSWTPVKLPCPVTGRKVLVLRSWSRYRRNDCAFRVPVLTGPASHRDTASYSTCRVSLQMLYLGFERDVSEAALRLTAGDVQAAAQLLLDNRGVLSAELLSMSPPSTSSSTPSPSSDEPSTSSNATGKTWILRRTHFRPHTQITNKRPFVLRGRRAGERGVGGHLSARGGLPGPDAGGGERAHRHHAELPEQTAHTQHVTHTGRASVASVVRGDNCR